MIAKGTPHANGAVLARYLVTGKDKERAELWELRGFAASGIVDAFRSVHVIARGTKCEAPFFHVYVRNPDADTLDRAEWEYTANSIERILGLTDQPRAIAFHIAESGHTHMHVAWSRIDADSLTAKPLPFYKRRLKTVSRELEHRLGLTLVPNERQSSIKHAPTRAEEEQARRLGLNIHDVRETIRNCFERSDCGRTFQMALSHAGMVLARGDRRDFLVVDRAGGVHALGKRILDVSAAEIRARLADLSRETLPTLDQARAMRSRPSYAAPHSESLSPLFAARTPRDPVLESIGATDIAASEAVNSISVGESTADLFQGQQEKNVSSEELDQSCEAAAPREPRPSISPVHSETPEPHLPQRTVVPPVSVAGNIRNLFRAVMKALTRSEPAPQPQKAKRKDETATGFKCAARALFRRVGGLPLFHDLYQDWGAFTWLKIWEYDNPESMECHQDAVKHTNSDFSPHP